MPRFACIIALFFASALAQSHKTILYIAGDYSSINYHIGVLSEIEKLQIRIDSIVASGESALAGALWSAGFNANQIGELINSWEKLQRAPQEQKSALWQKKILVKHNEDGAPIIEDIKDKPYFGDDFFNLQVQEAYWRADIGSKIPFIEIDPVKSYPFPPLPEPKDSLITRIFSNPIALRDTSGISARHYQMDLWSKDSSLIIIRPHSKPNPDSLFKAGAQAAQNKRSQFSAISQISQASNYQFNPPPPRFLYIPVFDSVPAEQQRHLESFWNKSDTGSLAVKNFLEALQKDGSYQKVKLDLDTGSYLQINAETDPILSLSLQGIGGSLFGANAVAGVNLRYVGQFGYDLSANAIYGQGIKGVVFEGILARFLDNGDFFAKAKMLEFSPSSYFQNRQEMGTKVLNEKSNSINTGIEMTIGDKKSALIVGIEIDRREITTDASGYPIYDDDDSWRDLLDPGFEIPEPEPVAYEYYEVTAGSMFPYVKWVWQSGGYDRWFAVDGFAAELLGGFKAVSVRNYDPDAPLYVSTQGKTSITHPLSKYVSVMGGAEFGANFRKTKVGTLVLPRELLGKQGEDPALENRYRFAMGTGEYQEQWQSLDNASHRYGLLMSGIALHLNGNGFFAAAGFAKDGEPNPWAWHLGQERFFAEPKIRIKTSVFDFAIGQNILYFKEGWFENKTKKTFFLEFRGGL